MIKHPITKPTKHLDVHRSSAIFSKQSKHQNTWCFSVSGTVVSVLMLFMVAMTPAFWYSPTRFFEEVGLPLQTDHLHPVEWIRTWNARSFCGIWRSMSWFANEKTSWMFISPKMAIYMYRNMHFYSLLLYIYIHELRPEPNKNHFLASFSIEKLWKILGWFKETKSRSATNSMYCAISTWEREMILLETDEICGGAKSEKLCNGFSSISWFMDPPNFLELNAESPFNGNQTEFWSLFTTQLLSLWFWFRALFVKSPANLVDTAHVSTNPDFETQNTNNNKPVGSITMLIRIIYPEDGSRQIGQYRQSRSHKGTFWQCPKTIYLSDFYICLSDFCRTFLDV